MFGGHGRPFIIFSAAAVPQAVSRQNRKLCGESRISGTRKIRESLRWVFPPKRFEK
jgi:hypothetical protein